MKNEIVHIRLEKEIRVKLQKMADKDNRTLSDYMRVQLIKLIEGKLIEKPIK